MASFWKTCLKQKLKRVTAARQLNVVTYFFKLKANIYVREKVLIPEKKATT